MQGHPHCLHRTKPLTREHAASQQLPWLYLPPTSCLLQVSTIYLFTHHFFYSSTTTFTTVIATTDTRRLVQSRLKATTKLQAMGFQLAVYHGTIQPLNHENVLQVRWLASAFPHLPLSWLRFFGSSSSLCLRQHTKIMLSIEKHGNGLKSTGICSANSKLTVTNQEKNSCGAKECPLSYKWCKVGEPRNKSGELAGVLMSSLISSFVFQKRGE